MPAKKSNAKVISGGSKMLLHQSNIAVYAVVLFLVIVLGGLGFTYWAKYAVGASSGEKCKSGYVPFASTQDKVGKLSVYYNKDAIKAERYCAIMMSRNEAYGVKKFMEVDLPGGNKSQDKGKYKYYAGPAYGSKSGTYGYIAFEKDGYTGWQYWIDQSPPAGTPSNIHVTQGTSKIINGPQ